MIIAITENASGAHWAQKTLDVMWDFLNLIPDSERLPENTAASSALAARQKRLALPQEPYAPFSPYIDRISGTHWHVTAGELSLGDRMRQFMSGGEPPAAVTDFDIDISADTCAFTFKRGTAQLMLEAATDGSRRRNILDGSQALVSAAWTSDDTLQLTIRIVEGCFVQRLAFGFKGTQCTISPLGAGAFGISAGKSATASRV
jgi:hypothetical protein